MTLSAPRQRLPNRRTQWLYKFEAGGQMYTGGIGRFDDGRIAEIFINGAKVGSAAEANAQDSAIVAPWLPCWTRSKGGPGTRAHERDDHG